MAKRSIEEIYRDNSIPDDRRIADLIADLGEDATLADLRRAYRGFEQRMSAEAKSKQELEDQYKQIYQNAASRIAELEQQTSDYLSGSRNQPPAGNAADPWSALYDDPTVAPILRAIEGRYAPALGRLNEFETSLKQKDDQIKGLAQFIGKYGDVLLTETARRDFDSIQDRDQDITFDQVYQTAVKEELYNDIYRQKDPNMKIPDVRKSYDRLSGPKRQEKLVADAEKRGRESALKEMRGQTFFPPPSSSALGNNPSGAPKNMDEAFASLSNDPELRNLFGI